MPSAAHDPRMGTNERHLDMLEKRARDAISVVAERDARRIVAIWDGRRAKGISIYIPVQLILTCNGRACAPKRPATPDKCPAVCGI
jgi:hypothetical protein